MKSMVEDVIQSTLQDSSALNLPFVNTGNYNESLQLTFRRTVSDIHELAQGRQLSVLEVGAFTGVVSVAMRRLGHEVTASDIDFVLSDPTLSEFLSAEGIALSPADLSGLSISLPDDSFDLVVFNEVIEHLNFNPIPLLHEFGRLLRPSGMIYCGTPNLCSAKNRWLMMRGRSYINPVEHLIWNLQPDSGMSVGLHWREWAKEELIELFAHCGFELQQHKFGLVTENKSGFPRRQMVKLLYRICPTLMPTQVGVFRLK